MPRNRFLIDQFADYMEFPETYDWEQVDSKRFSLIAGRIVKIIQKDLGTKDRNYVPGLRLALIEIAKFCTL